MKSIKNWTQDQITIDFHPEIYERLQNKYKDFNEFLYLLNSFTADLVENKDLYNINPYQDIVNKGIYILGKHDSKLNVFPKNNLALKCSQGQIWAEDLRKQFYKTIKLSQTFESKLNPEEKNILQVCPVYLHIQNRKADSFFKQIFFMQKIDSGVTLGQTKTGFNKEFRETFKIPSLEEIEEKNQFKLHLHLDKDKHRQVIKIQTVYLFKRLVQKGIRILSLNQKNILVDKDGDTGKTKYIIIDASEDFFPPITPAYNILTSQLCT